MLPRPEPTFAGTLLAVGGGLVAVGVDLKELRGSAAGTGCGSGAGALVFSSTGGLAAGVACSLETSAKGVRGCFGSENTGVLAAGFGAGRVYTRTRQPRTRTRRRAAKRTLREEATVPIDHVFAQEPPIAKLVVALEELDTVAFR
jgi:hypothetical protein